MQNTNNIIPRRSNGTIHPVVFHPDPILAAEKLSWDIIQRFYSKVNKTDEHWDWIGGTDGKSASGIMSRGGAFGNIKARRVSWLIHYGALPLKTRVFVTCGSPLCVNPKHLKLKDALTNPPLLDRPIEQCPVDMSYSAQDPTLPKGFSMTFRTRFWEKVDKTSSPFGCWQWIGGLNNEGYGGIGKGRNQDGNTLRAHVASWIIHNGPVPEGMFVLHDCPGGDNKGCVNPEHLWLGTKKQNSQDATKKSRARINAHWNARLTAEQVISIKHLYSTEKIPIAELARRFTTSTTTISGIVHNKRWTHIK